MGDIVDNLTKLLRIGNHFYGRIDGIGTHEELLATNEIYRDVYESQQAGAGDFDEGGAN